MRLCPICGADLRLTRGYGGGGLRRAVTCPGSCRLKKRAADAKARRLVQGKTATSLKRVADSGRSLKDAVRLVCRQAVNHASGHSDCKAINVAARLVLERHKLKVPK